MTSNRRKPGQVVRNRRSRCVKKVAKCGIFNESTCLGAFWDVYWPG